MEPAAAWALASALGSWFVVPVAPAIMALVLGRQALVSMHRNGTSGEGLVVAARVLAWLNIAVWGGLVVGVLILLVAFGTFAGLSALVDTLLPAG